MDLNLFLSERKLILNQTTTKLSYSPFIDCRQTKCILLGSFGCTTIGLLLLPRYTLRRGIRCYWRFFVLRRQRSTRNRWCLFIREERSVTVTENVRCFLNFAERSLCCNPFGLLQTGISWRTAMIPISESLT